MTYQIRPAQPGEAYTTKFLSFGRAVLILPSAPDIHIDIPYGTKVILKNTCEFERKGDHGYKPWEIATFVKISAFLGAYREDYDGLEFEDGYKLILVHIHRTSPGQEVIISLAPT